MPACAGLCAASALLVGCNPTPPQDIQGDSILTVFAPPTPQEAAAWAVDPYDADKRYRGILLLANAPWGGEEVYMRMYEQATGDGDAGVRAVALRGLALHGTPEHAELMVAALSDTTDFVRWEAARALQRVYAPQAVPALIERTKLGVEASTEVRAAAARALGQYPERRVAQALVAALDDRQLTVNHEALTSLRTLTGEDLGYDARRWLAYLDADSDPFAGRVAYQYPVFSRDPTWWEWMLPFFEPPNETAGSAIGAPAWTGEDG